jgi:subfamily B ATP-binding cassette protein MsbA
MAQPRSSGADPDHTGKPKCRECTSQMTKDQLKSNPDLYVRLLSYLKPYWKVFALAVIGMVGTAATEPVFPAIMKYLLDNGFKTDDARMVWLIPLGIVFLFLVRSVFVYCTGYLMMWISSRLVTDLRRDMFAKLLVLPTHHYDEHSAGQLISRLIYDVNNVTDAATSALISVVRESLTAIALIAYLLYLDWKLTLITLTIGPVIAFIVKAFGQRMRAASRKSLDAMRTISHTVEETVSAERVVKIFGGQHRQLKRFFEATENFRRAQMREAIPASAVTPITHIAASVAIAIIAYLALSQSTGQAGTSPGGFISFITAMLLLISPIKQLTTVSTTVQRGLAAAESVFSLLDTPQENDLGNREILRAKGEISFKNVSFRYPGAERQTLEDINFHVDPGQTVALVGASGGGKTTISALIPRFYAVTSGSIAIDGIDTQEVTLQSLRQNIALVSQDIVLFNDTIEANIAYGSLGTFDRAAVTNAARAANAWDFIEQLPNGLDTMVGENGAKLSGGQRQRLAIARALLKDAPILILDEATSALDSESERQVQSALAVLMKNRTTLVIAHRLSTIEHADRILVVDKGQIIESGSHTQLMSAGGYYANLRQIQA